MAGFTSCSSDDPIQGTSGEVTVTVTASLPADMQSRAFSDGETATKFFYAVYEKSTDGTTQTCIIPKTAGTDFSGLQTTLSLPLVTGKTYTMVFWAQSQSSIDNSLFTVADDLSTVTVNYAKLNDTSLTLTMEDMDAFWCFKEVPVSGPATVTAELKRPFAQINVGTNDLTAASVASKKVYTEMTVADVYSQYNLLTGDIVGTAASVTFNKTLRPNDGVATTDDAYEIFPVGTKGQYEYLAMAYVLMSKDKWTADIDLDFYFDAETAATNHLDVDAAPLQRNYRTNIFGALLTSTIDFTIVIKPEYEKPDYGTWGGGTVAVTPVTETIDGVATQVYHITSAENLAWMVENGPKNAYIVLDTDIDLNSLDWTPFGNVSRNDASTGFAGTIEGNGQTIYNLKSSSDTKNYGCGLVSVAYNATLRNLTFVNPEVSAVDFCAPLVGAAFGDTEISNITVVNGTATSDDVSALVCSRAYGTSTTITNCTVSGTVSGAKTGGIIGIASNGGETVVTNCSSSATVTSTTAGGGGIIGYVGSTTTVSNCENTGNIGDSNAKYSAGIVGYAQNSSSYNFTISGCTNSGKIEGNNAGGIFGAPGSENVFTVENCVNEGEIIGGEVAGGIASGLANGSALYCSNKAKVTATSTTGYAGGIAGQTRTATVTNCSGGTAAITATYAGRLLGCLGCKVITDEVLLTIDDTNGDAYTDLATVGAMAPYSSQSTARVVAGTFHGDPGNPGTAAARMIIPEGSAWDLFPGETGTWNRAAKSSTWVKAN